MVSQFGSLGNTIMGKTADLTVVQKTIIDTLHKEGKTQTFITKEAVHRVLYPSMLTEDFEICFCSDRATEPKQTRQQVPARLPSFFKISSFVFNRGKKL